ncbi:MAG: exonuclease SbcCD subunit D C-terminal domain-containing protein [Thermotogae bacterium]|nr:exonuclease SbcCD subunit D C-terminal domain-containing protein [Thermotogota bacterium]
MRETENPPQKEKTLTVLHTSDWHLGRMLYDKKRYDEHEAFLAWLSQQIREQDVDVLVVAGDIFDTATPSHRAQALYYRFLNELLKTECRHVVLIGGNHDSPTFLDAPRELLRFMDIHVIGSVRDPVAEEVLILKDKNGRPRIIVGAAPFLRDKDIRFSESGETLQEKEENLARGIRDHYRRLCEYANAQRAEIDAELPLLVTGHLFASGGKTIEGDGVRELYIGSLARVDQTIFPDSIDYLALGHLHIAQTVGGDETRRYSGSPLPMGFGEAGQQKYVFLVIFQNRQAEVTQLPIPVFQRLERVVGDLIPIREALEKLKALNTSVWVEVSYQGAESANTVSRAIDEMVVGSRVEVLRKRNLSMIERSLSEQPSAISLEELSPEQVFEERMNAENIPPERRDALIAAYQEILREIKEADPFAE